MEDLSYLEIFRQRWLAILVAVAAGVVSAALIAFSIPPTYTATATLFLVVNDENSTLAERSQFSLARVNSYTDLVRSSNVLRPVIKDLELDLTVQELSSMVSATNPNSTVNINITARAGSAADSSAIANAVADSLSQLVARVENFGTFTVSLDRLIPALTPVAPSAPQKTVILGLGLLSGLAGGAIIALLLARFDRRIRSVNDVRRATGLAVLGAIPRRHRRSARDQEHYELDAAVTETVTRIAQANGGGMPRLLLLVPTGHKSGAPQVRLALAEAVAATGRQTLLVESETTNDESSPLAEFAGGPGLAELLTGSSTLSGVIRIVEDAGSFVVPAGIATLTEAQAQASFRSVATQLFADADVVITQIAPVASPVSIQLVAPYADVSVIVVRHNHSTEVELAQAVSQLRIAGVRPIGVVLVEVPRTRHLHLMATWTPEDFATKPAKALITPRRIAAAKRPPAG
ncbi:Wzz/FepE/Etk N-terminal domain-containing protein [Salinibacterium sp. TMP30]|uniref:Wzz/FepE/Etk N-terminal domain-containing protein n=1 Tax=Salinibacterium sp. TMP30 TaxID=3138237 RepID=UPI0031387067